MSSSAPTIMVVDDDAPIRRVIRIAAESVGYRIVESATANEARVKSALERPDVIILDLGLPDGDGLDVLASIRSWSAIPVIILTARVDDDLVVRALDAGADDYIEKPFNMPSLLARVRVALRHAATTAADQPVQVIGPITIDHTAHKVFRGTDQIHLTATEYDLLLAFARHCGRVVTHSMLLKDVWGSPEADPQLVRVYVRQLRSKLEEDPAHPKLIRTEIGVGYRMEC